MDELRVEAAGATLAATRWGDGPDWVLVLHGSSQGTRDHALYDDVRDALTPAGVSTCVFDRRGEGASSGEPSVGDFALQRDDALCVLRALGTRRAVVFGFSQGAWVAPLVAVRDPAVVGLALVAATGVTPTDQMRYGVDVHLRRAGVPEHEVLGALALRDEYAAAMHDAHPDEADLARRLREASASPWWPLAHLPDEVPDAAWRAAWRSEMDYDPVPDVGLVRVPSLLMWGDQDEWTPVEPSARVWRTAHPSDATILVLDGVGHDLSDAEGRRHRAFAPALREFVVSVLAGSSAR